MKSVALHNLGCKVNAYEMDIMQDAFVNAGYKIVPFDQTADIYVINTCSVTNIADRKSRQMLHKAKAKNPSAIVVAAGCYVNTRGKDEVLSDDVDVVVSNTEKAEIANIVGKYIEEHDISAETVISEADVAAVNSIENAVKSHAEIEGNHTRAFIKVQDGCEMYCSYCIIPYARGQIRSRSIDDVTSELKSLVADGYHEFVITGIHLSSYGIDKIKFEDTKGDHINFAEFIKKYHAGKIDAPLLDLIDEVAKIDGVDRIRFGSLEPRIITDSFAEHLAAMPKICPQFHLSLQSGCDSVLSRMNRHYSTEEFYNVTEILRRHFDNPAITTDVIVGFPGETDNEFAETVEFLKKVNFYETHIFKYSRRKGTPADKMPDQLTDAEKHSRSNVLLDLNSKNKASYADSFIGKDVEVLFEEGSTGYTKEYVRVKSLDKSYENGTIVKGRITGRIDNELMEFSAL